MEGKRTRLYRHLKKWLEKAIWDYSMIADGDRVLVGVSGGADSFVLLELLNSPMIFTPPFSLLAAHIDLGFDSTGEDSDQLAERLAKKGVPLIVEKTDIGPLAHSDFNHKNPCFLCSRLRRRRLFEIAAAEGCTKIALAHHRDDIIETLLINIFFGREISTMVPNQPLFSGSLRIIRPLAYMPEELVKKYGKECGLMAMEERCPTSRTSRRRYIKDLLNEMEKDNRDVRDNIFQAMGHVKPDYLLAPPQRVALMRTDTKGRRKGRTDGAGKKEPAAVERTG